MPVNLANTRYVNQVCSQLNPLVK